MGFRSIYKQNSTLYTLAESVSLVHLSQQEKKDIKKHNLHKCVYMYTHTQARVYEVEQFCP